MSRAEERQHVKNLCRRLVPLLTATPGRTHREMCALLNCRPEHLDSALRALRRKKRVLCSGPHKSVRYTLVAEVRVEHIDADLGVKRVFRPALASDFAGVRYAHPFDWAVNNLLGAAVPAPP